MPIIGSSNFTRFFFSETGLTSYLDRDAYEAVLPLMFGVFEFLFSPESPNFAVVELTEELLLLEVLYIS